MARQITTAVLLLLSYATISSADENIFLRARTGRHGKKGGKKGGYGSKGGKGSKGKGGYYGSKGGKGSSGGKGDYGGKGSYGVPDPANIAKPREAVNPCAGSKIKIPNEECDILEVPQAGADITKGYQGKLETDAVPIIEPFWTTAMCPVNVHWHLGAEHRSEGQYDELIGKGPESDTTSDSPYYNRQLASKARLGNRCGYYDANDPKFTTKYNWKHCVNMTVGETYEVHWPHSLAGDCGTPNQYQYPFYDGVFCNADRLDLTKLPQQVGVQAQIFTIVNDDSYYYPNLFNGMIVDPTFKMGTEITKYVGSTTGTTRNNTICSAYSPITWQVDRKCHMISASTFDKMCADMKSQRDDMSDDLYAHGAREVVKKKYVADNQVHNRRYF